MPKIVFYRGDQYTILLTIKYRSSGDPIDITGYNFLLSVDPSSDPDDAGNQLFQVAGVLDGDPTTGKVGFPVTSTHSDQEPATYFYDVQMTTDTGDIRTILKDEFVITMDITK
jgi:hypothetical protein